MYTSSYNAYAILLGELDALMSYNIVNTFKFGTTLWSFFY